MTRLKAMLGVAVVLAVAGPANAVSVSFAPTSAVWSNALLTNGAVATITNFNATTTQISWGVAANPMNLRSSYLISANVFDPVEITAPNDSPSFVFANFTHNNYPITLAGGSLKYVKLTISGTVSEDGMAIGTKNFIFDFYHDETRNNLNPCPYGGANNQGVNINGCSDRVINDFNYDADRFKVNGVNYYLDPEEFRIAGMDAPVFYTKENAQNNAQLIGRFVPIGGIAAVPEPSQWALLIGGFGVMGAASRRRRVFAV